jgi:hypothetical protein
MKKLVISAIVCTAGYVQAQSPPWLDDRFLDSIRQVESGGNDKALSIKGARGPYQFMKKTWMEASKGQDFNLAYDPVISRGVCKSYFVWISSTITKWQGKDATWEQCAAAYNGGVGNLRKVNFDWHKMPSESVEYVEKVRKQADKFPEVQIKTKLPITHEKSKKESKIKKIKNRPVKQGIKKKRG